METGCTANLLQQSQSVPEKQKNVHPKIVSYTHWLGRHFYAFNHPTCTASKLLSQLIDTPILIEKVPHEIRGVIPNFAGSLLGRKFDPKSDRCLVPVQRVERPVTSHTLPLKGRLRST